MVSRQGKREEHDPTTSARTTQQRTQSAERATRNPRRDVGAPRSRWRARAGDGEDGNGTIQPFLWTAKPNSPVSVAPQTTSSFIVKQDHTGSFIPSTPRHHPRLPSSTAIESTSSPIASNKTPSGTRLPYPQGDYTSPPDAFSPTDQLTPGLHQRVDALAVGVYLGVAEYQHGPFSSTTPTMYSSGSYSSIFSLADARFCRLQCRRRGLLLLHLLLVLRGPSAQRLLGTVSRRRLNHPEANKRQPDTQETLYSRSRRPDNSSRRCLPQSSCSHRRPETGPRQRQRVQTHIRR
jgi:hypothetical protein